MKKIISALLVLILSVQLSAFAYNNYEYIDFEGTKSLSRAEGGFVFHLLDGSDIFVDEWGNVVDKLPLINSNISYKTGDSYETSSTIAYTNYGEKIFEVLNGEYEVLHSKNLIWKSSKNEDNPVITVYSKETGEEQSSLSLKEFGMDSWFNDEDIRPFINPDGMYGLIDAKGNILVEAMYEKIELSGEIFSAKKDGKWRFITKDNTLLKEFSEEYSSPCTFESSEDDVVKYLVFKDGYTIPLDKDFNEIPTGEYTFNEEFSKGIIKVSKVTEEGDALYGLMNSEGEVVLPVENWGLGYVCDDIIIYAPVGKMYFAMADFDGNIIVENCFLPLGVGMEYLVGDNGYIGIEEFNENNECIFGGYVDKEGNKKIKLPDGWFPQGAFSEGKASVVYDPVYAGYGQTAYIDEKGEFIIEPELGDSNYWTKGGEFKNDIALVSVGLGKAGALGSLLIRYTGDKPSDWAAEEVKCAIENQLVPQSLQKNYRDYITREQFCDLAFELLAKNNQVASSFGVIESAFPDTDSLTVNYLYSLGIINGREEWSRGLGTHIVFDPDSFINRQEAAKILDKLYDVLISKEDRNTEIKEKYKDDDQIEDWAREYVYSISNRKIMEGMGDNEFGVYNGYSIEQAIVTMLRLESNIPLN